MAGPDTGGEKLLYAEIDPEIIIDEKISHDLTGHYNRFDLFTLLVDDRPVRHRPVFKEQEADEAQPHYAAKGEPLMPSEPVKTKP